MESALPAASAYAHVHPEGERRHLTVLFCDLVDSTRIASQLDPEDWREMVASYHAATEKVVARFGGHVAQYLGDGLLIFFGYPQAHEDDPERAALAGLSILEAIATLNVRASGINSRPKFAVRIGIDTGSVVVGDSGGKGANVFGDTPNVAARVQSAAAPDTVMITGAVYRLISGLFVVEDRGDHALKGIDRPIRLYRVVRQGEVRGRLAAAAARGLTAFIGRDSELGALADRWERARAGEGQAILVVGEAGIGKSRLVQRFREQIVGVPHRWVDCAAAALHQNTPFYAITTMLQQGFGWRDEDAEQRVATLEVSLTRAGIDVAEAVPLLAATMSLTLPERYAPLQMAPEQQRRRLLATIVAWALGTARIQPLVVSLEDLHWADPSTLDVVSLLAEQCAAAPLLLILTARPEFRASWPLRAHHAQMTLNRLSARHAHEIVARAAGSETLAPALAAAVVERSGGVPLFIEELTRAVLENGAAAARAIPATLHDSLLARLDRLGSARGIAQMASVIGDTFSWQLLSATAETDDRNLEAALTRLVGAELLLEQGLPPEANYRFRHALIRDAAYESLLRSKREEYHRRVARVLEERFTQVAEAQPELLAHHYTQANLIQRAIPQWQLAGLKAMQRSANVEAVGHFTQGLKLLETMPETPERLQLELSLQVTLGTPLIATKGFASPEVEAVYARARQLCQQAGETPQLFPVLWGLWLFYTSRGQHRAARELAEQCLRLAQNSVDTGMLVVAHHVQAVSLIAAGDFVKALEHTRQLAALYDAKEHGGLTYRYGHDPAGAGLILESWVLWLLGYPEQAEKRCAESVSLAQKLNHPYTSATIAAFATWVQQFCRNSPAVEELASTAFTLSAEHDFVFYRAWATIMQGWVLAQRAQLAEGIAEMQQGLDAYRVAGAGTIRPAFLSLLAEAYGKAGQAEKGLEVLAEAQALADECDERWSQAELHRLKGELILIRAGDQCSLGDRQEAESCFHQALAVAQAQQAKSLELRAAMSLCRLGDRAHERPEARRVLEKSLGSFTEGWDTPDLREARALLSQS